MPDEIDAILADLLTETGASRVTLRRDLPGDYAFPVTNEALAPGVESLREEHTVDLRTPPVALEVVAGRQVVQDDSATAFDDPAFHRIALEGQTALYRLDSALTRLDAALAPR